MNGTPLEDLAALRAHVHGVPDVAARLAALDDDALVDAVLALARELQLGVTAADLAVASAASRREWVQRWIR